jgi:hypothetical protein
MVSFPHLTIVTCFFNSGYSNVCKAISYCDLIYISLMNLLAICRSSFEKCHSSFSVHFYIVTCFLSIELFEFLKYFGY